jgi:hypothetical protein
MPDRKKRYPEGKASSQTPGFEPPATPPYEPGPHIPKRVQLRRARGWRIPENTVKVDRTTKWGNPFTIAGAKEAGYRGSIAELQRYCVEHFRAWLTGRPEDRRQDGLAEDRRAWILSHIGQLRGHDLACWCALDQPCHADVLLQLANAPIEEQPK